LNGLFGRDARLAELNRRLAAESLLTIHGPAGTGKTRLAQEAAKARADVVWCDLSLAEDVRDAGHLLLGELGAEGRNADEILEVLAEQAPLLVVFDNAEHLADSLAPLLADFVRRGPSELKFLVTSRHVLGLAEEGVFELGALEISDAKKLLSERTSRLGKEVSEIHLATIVELLENNPLAIEMAAGLFSLMSAEEMIARLRINLPALRSTKKDVQFNHVSLSAAVEWSLVLLSTAERLALAELLVFRAPFSLEAAGAILDCDPVDSLSSLVAKSILVSQTEQRGSRRISLPAIVREVARGRKEAPSEGAILRHTAWFRLRAVTMARALRKGTADVAELLFEAEDVRAVLQRGLSAEDRELAAECALALEAVFGFRGPLERHVEDLRACWNFVKRAEPFLLGALVGARLGLHETATGNPAAGRDTLLEAVAWAELLSANERARVFSQVGHAFATSGFWADGIQLLERSRAELDSPRDRCLLECRLAEGNLGRGNYLRAEELLAAADRALAEAPTPRLTALVTATRATANWLQGQLASAEAGYRRAWALAEEAGDYFSSFNYVAGIAGTLHQRGDLKAALDFAAEAASLAERCAHARHHGLILLFLTAVQAEQGLIDDARASLHRARQKLERAAAPDREPLLALLGELIGKLSGEKNDAPAVPHSASSEWWAIFSGLARAVERRRGMKVELPAPATLSIGPEESWFSVDGGPRHELANKRVLRPLLSVLVARHFERGPPITDQELRAVLWPGDRMSPASAKNRLHVALHGLRAMGLGKLIRFEHNGWILSPELEVRRHGIQH
jgi:hypothetical protein